MTNQQMKPSTAVPLPNDETQSQSVNQESEGPISSDKPVYVLDLTCARLKVYFQFNFNRLSHLKS